MDRIKRICAELMERYPDKFGIDFNENKKVIKEVSIVRSKVLRNRLAGYITSNLRRQAIQREASLPQDVEALDSENLPSPQETEGQKD